MSQHPEESKEIGENRLALYELRRRSPRRGPFDQERVSLIAGNDMWIARFGQWRSVGTTAQRHVRGLEQDSSSSSPYLRTGADRAIERQKELAFWRAAAQSLISKQSPSPAVTGRLTRILKKTQWLPPRYELDRGIRFRWALPLANPAPAVYLSLMFGAAARRLGVCKQCEDPFVTPAGWMPATCEVHRPGSLPPRLQRLWELLRRRLDRRVTRKRLSSGDRNRLLNAARSDLDRVKRGEMPESAWRAKHDDVQKPGRPRKTV